MGANTIVLANRKVMRNACVHGCVQGADKIAFREEDVYINSPTASSLTLNAGIINRTGTVTRGFDFTDATLTPAWANGFITVGSGNGSSGDQHSVANTGFYIPIQVNMVSTSNPTAVSHFSAAMLRTDVTTGQGNTSLDTLCLRQKLGATVYAASCINASIELSAGFTMGAGTLQGIFCQIYGSKTITKTGSQVISVIEASHNVSAGTAVDNVVYASNIGAAVITSVIKAMNWGGATATHGLYVSGAGTLTNGVTIDHSCSKFLNITGTIAAGANNRAISSVTTMAVPAFEDGYGANEFDLTTTGTATGHQACMSVWVNATSGDPAGSGSYVVPITTGIYETASYTPTAQKIVTGMRMQGLLAETGYTSLSCFSINYNQAMTGFIECDYSTDNGVTVGTASVGPTVGYFKLLCNAAGTATRYVRLYATTT